MKRSSLLLCFLWACSLVVWAQPGRRGEIEDAEIVIEKNKKIELPQVPKPLEKILFPLRPTEAKAVRYNYLDFKPSLPEIDSRIRVLTMKPEPLDPLYSTWVKAGIGNYLTTYLEGWHTSKRTDDWAYGVHVKHLASANGPKSNIESGSGTNLLEGHVQKFNPWGTIIASAHYQRDRYNFFGLQTPREIPDDSVKQVFQSVGAQVRLQSPKDTVRFVYSTGMGYTRISDKFYAEENEFLADFRGKLFQDQDLAFTFDVDASLAQRKDTAVSTNRNLLRSRPGVWYRSKKFVVNAGLNLASENDTVSNTNRFHVYPSAQVDYFLVPGKLTILGGVDGNMEKTSFRQMVRLNPWMTRSFALAHTNKLIDLYGGTHWRLGQAFNLRGRLGYKQYKNLPLMVNMPGDSARFAVLYDRGTFSVLYVNLEASQQFGTKGWVQGSLQLNNYSMGREKKPWHLPNALLTLQGGYRPHPKVEFSTEINFVSGLSAREASTGKELSLSGIFDWDLRSQYNFSENFSLFLELDNIISQKNQRYLYYPNRGILVLFGVSGRF